MKIKKGVYMLTNGSLICVEPWRYCMLGSSEIRYSNKHIAIIDEAFNYLFKDVEYLGEL